MKEKVGKQPLHLHQRHILRQNNVRKEYVGNLRIYKLVPLNYPCPHILLEKCTQFKDKSERASAAHGINTSTGAI